MDRNRHCGACGAPFAVLDWPRACAECPNIAYRNPLPVVVAIQPIMDNDSNAIVGIVTCRRAIKPHIGEWSLVSGHMEWDDDVISAARREFLEETSVEAGATGNIIDQINNGSGILIFFVEFSPIREKDFANAQPCSENLEVGIARTAIDLCFPHHDRHLKDAFSRFRIGQNYPWSEELFISLCIRYDHGFGIGGFGKLEDYQTRVAKQVFELFEKSNGGVCGDRQLDEELTGRGFYSPETAHRYRVPEHLIDTVADYVSQLSLLANQND